MVNEDESLLGEPHACIARNDAKPGDKLVETLDDCSSYGRHQDEPAKDEEGIFGSLDVLPIALSIGQLIERSGVGSYNGT